MSIPLRFHHGSSGSFRRAGQWNIVEHRGTSCFKKWSKDPRRIEDFKMLWSGTMVVLCRITLRFLSKNWPVCHYTANPLTSATEWRWQDRGTQLHTLILLTMYFLRKLNPKMINGLVTDVLWPAGKCELHPKKLCLLVLLSFFTGWKPIAKISPQIRLIYDLCINRH